MFASLRLWWFSLNLARQFAAMAVAILLPAMLAVGWWISDRISQAVVHNTAAAIALYMDGLLAPFVPEIEKSGAFSEASRQKLDDLLKQSRAESRIVSMKVWRTDGTIIYSSFHDMIGKKFPLSNDFKKALAGEFGADFEGEPHIEDSHERESGKELLEVYAPVRNAADRGIVAISEFYANGNQLGSDIWRATLTSWAIVFAATSLVVFLLSGVVARGSRTILEQRKLLAGQVQELKLLLQQNEGLRASLRKANEDVANINERVLQQVGSDLHDGPAQMLAYVTMRLSKLRRFFANKDAGEKELVEVSRILGNALQDVRKTSQGLILPELKDAKLHEAVDLAITTHEDHTGSKVERALDGKCGSVPQALTACAYRLVQEALNNAFKHASGRGQRVVLRCVDDIEISIQDAGRGFDVKRRDIIGLGISGMRARVQALGGQLEVKSAAGSGTHVKAIFRKADIQSFGGIHETD